jgi:menaquinone-dependent protoporphyrinogen oxidase
MNTRMLVAYASRAGSTAEVARAVGEVLRAAGHEVDVRPVKEVHDLMGYDALVLGSAIWAGKPLPEAVRFAKDQRNAFVHVPVAYFILCDTLREDTPENREVARNYLAPLDTVQLPVSAGLFGGVRDFSKLNPLLRWFLKNVVRLVEGDGRNWDAINAWAASLPDLLTPGKPSLTSAA